MICNEISAGYFTKSFQENGYVVIPGVYSMESIFQARKIFDDAFKRELWKHSCYDSPEIINDIYRHFPALASLIFNSEYFQAIRYLIGENMVWLPECAVHRNRYVPWHKDTTAQEINGVKSHYDNEGAMLQVAVYFQDNSTSTGGGVTVIPGSHFQKDRFIEMYRTGILTKLGRKFQKLLGLSVFHRIERRKQYVDIRSNAGDLVIFDLRIDHRSTLPKTKVETDKYAVFNTFGNPTTALSDYFEFMKFRKEPYYKFLQQFKVPDIIKQIAKHHEIKVWE